MKNYNIVVSVNNNDVIGYNNQLLIESKEDLKRFYQDLGGLVLVRMH